METTPVVVTTLADVPYDVIVDFSTTLGPGAGFRFADHCVYLESILRQGNNLQFVFRATSTPLADYRLIFCRELYDPEFTVSFAHAVCDDPAVCDDDSLWTGVLVTGDLSSLETLIPSTGSIVGAAGYARVEPSTVANWSDAYVRSIRLANEPRTLAAPPAGCGDAPTTPDDYYVYGGCLDGDLQVAAGYNALLELNLPDNALRLDAVVAGGAGEPCEDIPLFEGELPPDGGELLSGGLRCSETVKSLAGASGRSISIEGGRGVTVTVVPEDSTLIVAVDDESMEACQ